MKVRYGRYGAVRAMGRFLFRAEMMARIESAAPNLFDNVYCSQCGQCFGPGDSGFSHCKDHQHLKGSDE